MWTFAPAWEEALWAAARELLPAGALESKALAAAIEERTRRYTSERARLGAPVAAKEKARDLAARALFFTVADAAKIAVPLAELAGRGLLPASEPLRVLDVGAGCGAMTLGIASALPEWTIEAVAVDRDTAALEIFARAVALGPGRVKVTPRIADAGEIGAGVFDLAVAGTVLNELPPGARVEVVRKMLGALAPGGAVIVIEPALRETSRALHELRDELLRAGDAHVFAPCTRAGAPCPALADERDWCHEDRPFQPPPRLASLTRTTGLRQAGLKFAYLTLRRDPAPLAAAPPGLHALRVVSEALDQKGTIERIVCGDAGRTRLRLLRRDRTDNNRDYANTRRGDVVLVDDDLSHVNRVR